MPQGKRFLHVLDGRPYNLLNRSRKWKKYFVTTRKKILHQRWVLLVVYHMETLAIEKSWSMFAKSWTLHLPLQTTAATRPFTATSSLRQPQLFVFKSNETVFSKKKKPVQWDGDLCLVVLNKKS